MLSWLTTQLNAGATDIVINLGDNYKIGDGTTEIVIARKITDTIMQSDADDGTINLTVSGVNAAYYAGSYIGNTKLKTITLPDATILGSNCFDDCTNLTAIYVPKVTRIYGMPIGGCDNLTTLELTAVGVFLLYDDARLPWDIETSNIDLKLNADKKNDVIQNEDGTGTWNGSKFKSITFVN